jgi:hypothetical protein
MGGYYPSYGSPYGMPGMPGIPPLPPPKALFIFGVAKLNEQLFDVYTSGVTSDERNQNRTVYGS